MRGPTKQSDTDSSSSFGTRATFFRLSVATVSYKYLGIVLPSVSVCSVECGLSNKIEVRDVSVEN